MEIERKFLIDRLPEDLTRYTCHNIQQAYLCTDPVIRIRRQDDDYILTYKSKGFLAREEYNLPLNQESYRHLLEKADGIILSKKRWLIPLQDDLTAGIDVFAAPYEAFIWQRVEFPSKEAAEAFTHRPSWFGRGSYLFSPVSQQYFKFTHRRKEE